MFDLIKVVRSVVQQTRQHFRDIVPKVIAGKYARKLSKTEWATQLHMAKTDLAALIG